MTAKQQETIDALKKCGGNREFAAAELGISIGSLCSRIEALKEAGFAIPKSPHGKPRKSLTKSDLRAKVQAKADKRAASDMERALFEAQEKLKIVEYVAEHSHVVRVIPPPTVGKKRPAIAVALASDWHVEEEVDPTKVNGKNAYNLEIARTRIASYFQGLAWKIRHHSGDYDIKRLLMFLLGDFISGYIHPELAETGQLAPGPAIVWWQAEVLGGIRMLLETFPELEIEMPCCVGNHERTTEKIRVATRVENSFGYIAYEMLRQQLANEPRVRLYVTAGAHVYAEAWDWKIRGTHGDDIRYQGGVGGLSIPLRKAVDAWNETSKADYTVFGHWHQHCDLNWAIGNGSLIGYAPYSLWIKARYEPPSQAFFLIDRERGKDYVSPIWVDEQGKR